MLNMADTTRKPVSRNPGFERELSIVIPKIKTESITDDYIINWKQKLGTGINGPVRPCTNRITGGRFALKILPDKPISRTELNLHMRCTNHPSIVKIYDVYANEIQFPGEPHPRGRLLLVMELMDGGELFDRISQQKGFTERKAMNYAKQIASAVYCCHSRNIAHRDLKPENLLLKDNTDDSPVKLSDFGFAKVDDGNLMTPHFTPYYVAPQVLEAQRRQKREQKGIIPTSPGPYTYDKSCDMWSLGVIIYIMLCGYPPFFPETPSKQMSKEMRLRIMGGQYEFPAPAWTHVSEEARDVVSRLLRVDPSERLQINDLMQHPWFQENRASDAQLHSPAIMLDKNLMDEARQVHSEQLTCMRLPEQRVTLKPVAKANNPIIRKRLRSKDQSLDNRNAEEQPPAKQRKENISVSKLRDVIAYCILPPKAAQNCPDLWNDGTDEEKLAELVQIACEQNLNCQPLHDMLQAQHWNGKQFSSKVNTSKLAHLLSDVVDHLSKQ